MKQFNLPQLTVPELFGHALKFLVAAAVLFFLGLHSINFFTFIFADGQSMYAYLGFALTGGGMVAYLGILKWNAKTDLQKAVAIAMLLFCTLGELAAAGFGMQLEGYVKAGYEFTKDDIDNMILLVQVLALTHAVALILDSVGDLIIAAFQPAIDRLFSAKPAAAVAVHPLLIPSPNSSSAPISEVRNDGTPSFPGQEAAKDKA